MSEAKKAMTTLSQVMMVSRQGEGCKVSVDGEKIEATNIKYLKELYSLQMEHVKRKVSIEWSSSRGERSYRKPQGLVQDIVYNALVIYPPCCTAVRHGL